MLRKPIRKSSIILALSCVVVILVTLAFIPRSFDREDVPFIVKSGSGIYGIARNLEREGFIWSSAIFSLFTVVQRGKLIAGEYTLSKNMSTIDIIRKMAHGDRNVYILKIIEGDNIHTIAERFEKSKIMRGTDFLTLATDREFSGRLGITDASIEGYLFPDTYHYSKEIPLDQFISKLVLRTLKLFEREDYRKRMQEIGFDMHKTLTLASMIEKETKVKEEKPIISGVFHNRLARGMSLDCDPTVIYGTGRFGEAITKADLMTTTPFNTYRIRGLPRGPIANPHTSSIHAALNPAKVDYLYFVSRNDGTHVFSKDMQEHNRYVMLYQRSKKTKKQ